MTYKDIIKKIVEMEDDEYNDSLEKAMHYFCSMWDIRGGMKHALIMTLMDQYDNHASEQDPKDLDKLSDILNGAI